jgi:hypothetical protein
VAAPEFPAGNIVYPIGPLDLKGYLVIVFKKREIAPFIQYFGQIDYTGRNSGPFFHISSLPLTVY